MIRRIVFAAECFLQLDSGDDRVKWREVVEWRKKDSDDTSIIACLVRPQLQSVTREWEDIPILTALVSAVARRIRQINTGGNPSLAHASAGQRTWSRGRLSAISRATFADGGAYCP